MAGLVAATLVLALSRHMSAVHKDPDSESAPPSPALVGDCGAGVGSSQSVVRSPPPLGSLFASVKMLAAVVKLPLKRKTARRGWFRERRVASAVQKNLEGAQLHTSDSPSRAASRPGPRWKPRLRGLLPWHARGRHSLALEMLPFSFSLSRFRQRETEAKESARS